MPHRWRCLRRRGIAHPTVRAVAAPAAADHCGRVRTTAAIPPLPGTTRNRGASCCYQPMASSRPSRTRPAPPSQTPPVTQLRLPGDHVVKTTKRPAKTAVSWGKQNTEATVAQQRATIQPHTTTWQHTNHTAPGAPHNQAPQPHTANCPQPPRHLNHTAPTITTTTTAAATATPTTITAPTTTAAPHAPPPRQPQPAPPPRHVHHTAPTTTAASAAPHATPSRLPRPA